MVAQNWDADVGEEAVLVDGAALWERMQDRIAHRFGRVEVRARGRRYLAGLLGRVERKNGWQLAEVIGEAGPQGVQRLLNAAVWDAEAMRDDLRAYVIAHLGDAQSGVLVVDETDFPKKGRASCGVATQYCGSMGRSANAQVGVFLAYTSDKGLAFIDRALYLPRAWTKDRTRCVAADPDTRAFALGWSRFGRSHQAVARRERERHERASPAAPALECPVVPPAGLTDAEWERVRPLLPPQQPAVGRRRHDHRTVLGGILWVLRSAAPWREMPARFGKPNSVYVRYRLWRQQGLWCQIIEALGSDAVPPARAGPS